MLMTMMMASAMTMVPITRHTNTHSPLECIWLQWGRESGIRTNKEWMGQGGSRFVDLVASGASFLNQLRKTTVQGQRRTRSVIESFAVGCLQQIRRHLTKATATQHSMLDTTTTSDVVGRILLAASAKAETGPATSLLRKVHPMSNYFPLNVINFL